MNSRQILVVLSLFGFGAQANSVLSAGLAAVELFRKEHPTDDAIGFMARKSEAGTEALVGVYRAPQENKIEEVPFHCTETAGCREQGERRTLDYPAPAPQITGVVLARAVPGIESLLGRLPGSPGEILSAKVWYWAPEASLLPIQAKIVWRDASGNTRTNFLQCHDHSAGQWDCYRRPLGKAYEPQD